MTVQRSNHYLVLWDSFDTLVGGLQFSDQFLQIATRLDSDKVYGFGEREHRTLLHDLSKYNTESMYARDIGVGVSVHCTRAQYMPYVAYSSYRLHT